MASLPPPQNSRAGLITAVVVFVIFSVTSTILAFYYANQWQAEINHRKAEVEALSPAVTATVMATPEVSAVVQDARGHSITGIELAIQQRNAISKLITGNPAATVDGVSADTARTIDSVRTALGAKDKKVADVIKNDDLLSNLKLVTNEVVSLVDQLATSDAATKTAEAAKNQVVAERDKLLADKDTKIADANKKADDAGAEKAAREQTIGANIKDIQDKADASVKAAQDQTTAAQAEVAKLQPVIKKQILDLDKGLKQLARYRANPSRSLLQPAGIVTRVPGDNTCYINLGKGMQISPGLTFEVYDKKKGLPSLTASNPENPDALPAGKASIEVIRIMDGTSECRIISEAVGYHVVEGDLVLNLIYNTHTKFVFTVYGDFDLSNAGQPTPGDADVIRRLITQWGARASDKVTIETDFLVLGKEPVVQPKPDNPTALDEERYTRQQKALDNYQLIQAAAAQMNVPILNQNRFLYFIGYYDQARR